MLVALLTTGALLFAACGDDDAADSGSAPVDTSGDNSDSAAATESDTIDIVDFTYDPTPIKAAAGSEVSVKNEDGTPHTVTARQGEFNSESIAAGADGVFTVPDAPGSYDFYCSFHPFMEGTLVVE